MDQSGFADPPVIALVVPTADRLDAYARALSTGWSPDTQRDVAAEQLAEIARDPAAFIAEFTAEGGTVTLPDGRQVPRLPGRYFWIWDGDFAGQANLRHQPGSADLPPYVSGHVGYAMVPWRQRRGYATRALALLLPHARDLGLARVEGSVQSLSHFGVGV